jgi:hypothetical protein
MPKTPQSPGTEVPMVFVPGPNVGEAGEALEIGTDDFTRAAIAALGEDVLYRMDFVVGVILGVTGLRRFRQLDEHAARILIDEHTRLVSLEVLDDLFTDFPLKDAASLENLYGLPRPGERAAPLPWSRNEWMSPACGV